MFTLTASKIESLVDFLDDSIDQLAPLVAPEVPEVAIGLPIVDSLRKIADQLLGEPSTTPAQTARVTASMAQLDTAINAPPAVSA
jgi:hypothetical protein